MPLSPYGSQPSSLYLGNYIPLSSYLYANQGRQTQFSDPEVAQLNANAAATQAAAAAKTPAASSAGAAAPSLGALGLDESLYNTSHGYPFDWSTLGSGTTMTNAGPVNAPVTAAGGTGSTPPTTPTPGGGTGSGGTPTNPVPAPQPRPNPGAPIHPDVSYGGGRKTNDPFAALTGWMY